MDKFKIPLRVDTEKFETPIHVLDEFEIPLQPASLDAWDKKYRLRAKDGSLVDYTIEDTYHRVAKTLASIESDPVYWEKEFYRIMKAGCTPAGRILSNIGAGVHKPSTSTINCTVSGTIDDSMEGILDALKEAGMTLKAGCGIGYCFSTLRPKGSFVQGAGATTSGPLSFMDIFDSMCFTVSSAGGRRGAQMATFEVSHPDIEDYIAAKHKDGRLRQFNMSVLITDEFMDAVKGNKDWDLHFEGKVYKTVKAVDLWNKIMKSTYDYAEPGIIFIDRVNGYNNNWFCEDIVATNPCGEQPLPPYGACLLGSINVAKYINLEEGLEGAFFDLDAFEIDVRVFTRLLDNVVEFNNLPLPEQRKEIEYKRRHGMGITGLGSALALLGIEYGSKESILFTEEVCRAMCVTGLEEGAALAVEKGCAPILKDRLNRVKWLDSEFLKNVFLYAPELEDSLEENGCRFTHHTSIAPTGTISLSVNNNVSNGIEPSFSHKYFRNIIKEGRNTKEQQAVYSYEALIYKELEGNEEYPDSFKTAQDIDIKAHIDIQAAAQKWIDSAISKTINVPTDYPFEKFKDIYMYAYDKGLKGCTTFRFNPEVFQGVLVTEDNLEGTQYKFTLDNGEVIVAAGGDKVIYEGEETTAANLFDALKEGYYGRF